MAPPGEQPDDDEERHRREEADRRAKRKASKSSRTAEQIEKERQRKKYRQEILQQHAAGGGGSGGHPNRQQQIQQQQRPSSSSSALSKQKEATGSAFQELFGTRAQGFQIEFRFRNAPPRPPVGPCFVGETIDTLLHEAGKHYKPLNTVEVHHTWKLHTENDIGVPLAPSAMDLKSYKETSSAPSNIRLHPDDEELLNWRGSMGDTAAEQLKRRQEQARVAARLAASGRTVPIQPPPSSQMQQSNKSSMNHNNNSKNRRMMIDPSSKKEKKQIQFRSRVLREDMQTWMKKTTYLSNDYSRKVHDFKSLTQTKAELEQELQKKQTELSLSRNAKSIEETFELMNNNKTTTIFQHPTNNRLKPKNIYPVLPDSSMNWGLAFTHVIIDKVPVTLPDGQTVGKAFPSAFVTNVERAMINSRMSCHLIAPAPTERLDLFIKQQLQQQQEQNDDDDKKEEDEEKRKKKLEEELLKNKKYYESIQMYDLDVIPLKNDDGTPHSSFTLWLDPINKVVTYLPVASRVSLSTGRPPYKNMNKMSKLREVQRRSLSTTERTKLEERMAEIDYDMAEKYNLNNKNKKKNNFDTNNNNDDDEEERGAAASSSSFVMTTRAPSNQNGNKKQQRKGGGDNDDDGEDDFGDDDSDDDDNDSDDDDDEEVFGGGTTKTIVAEN